LQLFWNGTAPFSVHHLNAHQNIQALSKDKPAMTLRAGIAKTDITPHRAQVHDSTFVRTLIFDNGTTRIAIVAGDIIAFSGNDTVARLRSKYSLDSLLICCSHTHSGSLNPSKEYFDSIDTAMDQGIDQALKNLFEASLAAGKRSFTPLGYNRLIPRKNGYSRGTWVGDDTLSPLNPERIPYGPVDPEVSVVKIEDGTGKIRAVIMNYACHADVVASNFEVSADYPGVAAAAVEEHLGRQAVCLFVQGGAGNIAPLFVSPRKKDASDARPTDYSQMEKMGGILAAETIGCTDSMPPGRNGTGGIALRSDTLCFTGRFDKNLKFDIAVTTILINGTIAIAAFPGEPFNYFQKFWKENVEKEFPLFFGYTFSGGIWPGYVADIKSAAYGGFGADASADLIEIGAGEKIMLQHLENLYRLKGVTRDHPGPAPDWSIQHTFLR
jgi:hypothetical protein